MGTIHTLLEVINKTDQDIIDTRAYSCANYDWKGDARPDRNFNHQTIKARGGSVTKPADLNEPANNCPFTMWLKFSDGTEDEFRIHQKHVNGCCAGFNHIKRSHDICYTVQGNKLVIIVGITAEQLQKQQVNEAVTKLFGSPVLQKLGEMLGEVFSDKSYNEVGKQIFQEACKLEADTNKDKSQEAQKKFEEAKDVFEAAFKLSNVEEYKQNIKMVTSKIEGNRLFNQANNLEQEAFKLYNSSNSDNTSAQNKYKEALAKYEDAGKNFEEGAKINHVLDESVKIVKESIDAVKKVIHEIEQAELSHNIGKINVDDKKQVQNGNEQDVNTNLIQQVDSK